MCVLGQNSDVRNILVLFLFSLPVTAPPTTQVEHVLSYSLREMLIASLHIELCKEEEVLHLPGGMEGIAGLPMSTCLGMVVHHQMVGSLLRCLPRGCLLEDAREAALLLVSLLSLLSPVILLSIPPALTDSKSSKIKV